jgi:iron complex transport system substrate-binding protein
MASKVILVLTSLLLFVGSFSVRECLFPAQGIVVGQKCRSCRRIVSMAPSITEAVYAVGLGDRLVGVTRYCKYPPQVQSLPKVGGLLDPNFEAIVAIKPDLVIILEEQEQSLPGFQKLGLETRVVCHKTIDGIIESLQTIPGFCGVPDQGREIAENIKSRLKRIGEKTAQAKRPKVMIAVDRLQGTSGIVDVYIAGHDGYFDKMIELAGGENVYREGIVRFPVVSTEGIMRMNPDVVIDLVSGLDQEHYPPEHILADWHSLGDVKAVKQRRVYGFDRDYATVPGPRFIRFVEDLARLLHPEIDWSGS